MRVVVLSLVAALAGGLVWLLGSPMLGHGDSNRHAPSAANAAATATRGAGGIQARQALPIRNSRASAGRVAVEPAARVGAKPTSGSGHAPLPGSAKTVTLFIPRIGVRVPVVDRGIDAGGNLPIADGLVVTHYTFSAGVGAIGNYVAYGHDDIQGSVFQHLDALQVGDPIEVVRGDRRYLYRVTTARIVSPTDIAVLAPTPTATMTLITCTPYLVDTQRIVVDAALEGVEGL